MWSIALWRFRMRLILGLLTLLLLAIPPAFGAFKVSGVFLSSALLPEELKVFPPIYSWQGAPKETRAFSYLLCFDRNNDGRCTPEIDRILASGRKEVNPQGQERPPYLWFAASESALVFPPDQIEQEGWGLVLAPERYILCVVAEGAGVSACGGLKRLRSLRMDTVFLVTEDYLSNPTPPVFYRDLDALMPPQLKEDGVKSKIYLLRPGAAPQVWEAEVELRGSTSRTYPKRQFNVEFDDEISLFGLRKSDEYILNGAWLDRSFARDELAFNLAEALGRFGVRQHFVELFINGEYFGLYIIKEKINKDRIEVFTEEQHAQDPTFPSFGDKRKKETKRAYADRFILKVSLYKRYKPERLGVLPAPSILPADWVPLLRGDPAERGAWLGPPIWRWVYPSRKKVSILRETAVVRYLGAMWRETVRGGERLKDFVAFDSAADFAILQEISQNPDNYFASVYLYRPRGEKVRFISWDFDWAFGNPVPSPERAGGWSCRPFEEHPRGILFDTLFAKPEFRQLFRYRYELLRQGFLSSRALEEWFDTFFQRKGVPSAVLEDNFARWPADDPAYEQYGVRRFSGDELEFFKAWLLNRLQWLDEAVQAPDWSCR